MVINAQCGALKPDIVKTNLMKSSLGYYYCIGNGSSDLTFSLLDISSQ